MDYIALFSCRLFVLQNSDTYKDSGFLEITGS